MKNYLSKEFFDSNQQTLRKMKMTCLMVIAFVSSIFATNVESQVTKVSITLKDASITKVIDAIESQTDYLFVYNKNEIDINRKVDVDVKNQAVAQVLSGIFTNTNVVYAMEGTNIMLMQKQDIQQKSAKQQPKTVTGTVTDSSGTTLPGVSVYIKGSTNGTSTDANGKFTLNDVPENATVVFSFVGMKAQEIVIGNNAVIKVVMTSEAVTMEEVVVIGYGTVKKRDITGSISSVKGADLVKTANASVGQLLEGRAAGLQVTTMSAQPGGGMEFLIRGAAGGAAGNEPLIVVDGFPMTNYTEPSEPTRSNYGDYGSRSSLNSIDPNDVESIEVLKDASATAIYGSRAGHGVILITTKRGKSGMPRITYTGSTSFQNIKNDYGMLDATDFMIQTNRYEQENWRKKNKLGVYGPGGQGLSDSAYLAKPNTKPYKPIYTEGQIDTIQGTDWLSEVSRTGIVSEHRIGINGGTENTKYMVSFGVFNQKGVIVNTDLKRYTGRINFDQKLAKNLTLGINLSYTHIGNANAPISNSGNEGSGIIRSAIQFNPTLPVYDANGKYSMMPTLPRHANPVSLQTIQDNTYTSHFAASDFIEYAAFKNFKLRMNTGVTLNSAKRNSYMPQTVPIGADEKGRASVFNSSNEDYLFELTGNYMFTHEKHNFSVLGGYSYQLSKNDGSNMAQSNFITDALGYYLLGTGATPIVGNVYGGKGEIASYFTRLNYTYNDKYLFTATIRADGASQLAENNKWGYFPSAAFAWRLDQEDFMEGFPSVFSTLKPRVSFGQTGNANIGGNATAYYGVISSGYHFGKSETFANEVELFQLANNDLRWETTTELNFGLDMGFIKDRITASAEFYMRGISDLLATRYLMSYHSVNTLAYNVGSTQSQGIELTFNSRNIVKTNFTWSTDLTLSRYVDRWKEHDPSWKPAIWESHDDYLRPYLTYLSDGLVQPGEVIPYMPKAVPGQIKLKDINGMAVDSLGFPVVDANGKQMYTGAPDGKLDAADLVKDGSWDPKLNFGLNNTFTYKSFSLRVYLYGVLGKKMMNPLYSQYLALKENKMGLNKISDVKNCWAQDNQGSDFPSYFVSESEYGWGDFFVEDASFLRIKNITLNYEVKPKNFFRFIKDANIYVDVQNAFVFTKYSGVDPETDNYPGAYPNQITYSVGVNVTF